MEAMRLGYPPEQRGQISVTATPEEWLDVLRALDYMDDYEMLGDDARQLRRHLTYLGVGE